VRRRTPAGAGRRFADDRQGHALRTVPAPGAIGETWPSEAIKMRVGHWIQDPRAQGDGGRPCRSPRPRARPHATGPRPGRGRSSRGARPDGGRRCSHPTCDPLTAQRRRHDGALGSYGPGHSRTAEGPGVRRGRRDAGALPRPRLGDDAARRGGRVAAEPPHRGRHGARRRLPRDAPLRPRARPALQRRLRAAPRGRAPVRPRAADAGVLARGVGRHGAGSARGSGRGRRSRARTSAPPRGAARRATRPRTRRSRCPTAPSRTSRARWAACSSPGSTPRRGAVGRPRRRSARGARRRRPARPPWRP
jgi:hypothetical protein